MRAVLLSCALLCAALGSSVYRRELEESLSAVPGNSTLHPPGNDTARATRYNTIAQYMPTIKSVFIFVCGFSTFLIACLIVKIFRSGKRIRKTRKYDIITTPAERVEMAPLNEDNFEDEDSTVFDVKYRYRDMMWIDEFLLKLKVHVHIPKDFRQNGKGNVDYLLTG